MKMPPVDFSCTQRLMGFPTSNQDKESLEARVCGLFASFFLLLDASFHLLTGIYKGFAWTAYQVLQTPTDYQVLSHFSKALYSVPLIPFASLFGIINPRIFESKTLQEYLGWEVSLTKNLDTIEKALKSNNNEDSSSTADTHSITSENEVFEDAQEELFSFEDKIQALEKALRSLKKENIKLKNQLAKGFSCDLFESLKDRLPYNQILLIKKFSEKYTTSAPSIYNYAIDSIQKEINSAFNSKFQMNFCTFCIQETPNIELASRLFKELLNKHSFNSFTNPTEATLGTVINAFL
ncbi:MAG: hypothetical protein ACRDDW_04310 [Candidatus Rhabdochlamydia sp.]